MMARFSMSSAKPLENSAGGRGAPCRFDATRCFLLRHKVLVILSKVAKNDSLPENRGGHEGAFASQFLLHR
jgi:hypothetical protein